MEKPIIEIKNIGKRYEINHEKGRYVSLRDVIVNIAKNPIRFLKHKLKSVMKLNKKEEFWALRNIDLKIKRGEVIGVIGHNGAGKSTLLKILTGITPPTEGEIIMRGRVASLLEVGTGFHPELTGKENIFLNGAILGMTKTEITRKFDEIISFAGIQKFIDTPVKYYSSGMYVRLAFSVAAHMEPDILLVDEVLAVGDASFQEKCLGKMDEVTRSGGRTILLVSHNMGAIQKLCNKSILIEDGKVKMFGNTSDVIDQYLNDSQNLTKILIKDRKDRRGNGDLRITDCYIKNGSYRSNQAIGGDDMTLVFEYQCKSDKILTNIVVGMNVTNQQNEPLFICHNQMTKTDFGEITGNGLFECNIKHLPLVPGIYFANIRITSNDHEVDCISNIFRFEVLLGDFFKTGSTIVHSKIFVDHDWNIKSKQ